MAARPGQPAAGPAAGPAAMAADASDGLWSRPSQSETRDGAGAHTHTHTHTHTHQAPAGGTGGQVAPLSRPSHTRTRGSLAVQLPPRPAAGKSPPLPPALIRRWWGQPGGAVATLLTMPRQPPWWTTSSRPPLSLSLCVCVCVCVHGSLAVLVDNFIKVSDQTAEEERARRIRDAKSGRVVRCASDAPARRISVRGRARGHARAPPEGYPAPPMRSQRPA